MYQQIHDNLIQHARTRTLPDSVYTEDHHVIPQHKWSEADGNTDTVALTWREHTIVHYLLAKIDRDFSSLCAYKASLWKSKFRVENATFTPTYSTYKSVESLMHTWYGSGVNHPYMGETKFTHTGIASMSAKQLGQTKENSTRVASMAATKTGRTKETHAYVAAQATKRTGQNKHTNPAIASYTAHRSANYSGRNHPRYDPTIYHFKNIHTGKIAISDRYGMQEMYDIAVSTLFCAKPHKTCHGWQLQSI